MTTFLEAWRDHIKRDRESIKFGTVATSGGTKPCDLTRDDGDFFYVDMVVGDVYVGRWMTGFGFMGVQFPKDTTRDITDAEFEWLLDHPVSIG